ncbi:hypothetical protein JTE90_004747 [Oedothorax gibbosus]|uniref:Uncharacterized protein n=1 Tax=Oedothorax gibbosus TaxID=931172 RepID=A0AAV6TU02_9ARAC|nr:hypothetical protein JTE90_004747 [Oedothorax gibbosus]
MESPAPDSTQPATATTAPSTPTTPPVQPPLFKSVEVQTCHVWPTSGINPNNSQNASCSNSSTELSPSEIVQNNKPLQKACCNADSTHSGVIKNKCIQKCSSGNSSTELTSLSIQNNKHFQDASCSSSSTSDIVQQNRMQKSSSSDSATELTSSEIVQNNKGLLNASCSTESASSGIRQDNPMQRSSNSKNFSNNIATPGTSQSSSEADVPKMTHNSAQKTSSDNSCTESPPSVSNPLIKTSSPNSSVDLVAADSQQPSTHRTEDVSEVANCSTAAIPQICDNARSIGDGVTQSSRTLEATPMSETSSSVPVGSSGESLLVVATLEPSADNENLELATPAATDNLVEVDTTSIPLSTNSVDISAIGTISAVSPSVSTISSVNPSVTVSSSDVRAMSTTSVDVSPTTATCVEDSIYDVPRRLTISADAPPASIIPADVPLVSLAVLTDINIDNPTSSSDTATFSGDPDANMDLTQQTALDIGVRDMDMNNLSDGEVDDSELLDRFSPPPCYDDAIHEGESAIGAFGLAYGTI